MWNASFKFCVRSSCCTPIALRPTYTVTFFSQCPPTLLCILFIPYTLTQLHAYVHICKLLPLHSSLPCPAPSPLQRRPRAQTSPKMPPVRTTIPSEMLEKRKSTGNMPSGPPMSPTKGAPGTLSDTMKVGARLSSGYLTIIMHVTAWEKI